MAGGKKSLLAEGDDDDAREAEDTRLGFNEKFAERFMHNKKREDLHRLQELEKQGRLDGGGSDDDEESSSEDEDEDEVGLLPERTEEKILETLTKIRARDPSIYSAETTFFDEDAEEEEDEGTGAGKARAKKGKPLYLKDVNARHLLEGQTGEEEEDEEVGRPRRPPPTYVSEQEDLKRAFLDGVEEAEVGEDEDLLRLRKRTKAELERDAEDGEEAVEEAERRAKDAGIAKRLNEYFGKDDNLGDDEKFLKGYLLNKGWIDYDQNQRYQADGEEDLSGDEEALDEQDQYEKDWNFRFEEEPDNAEVRGHSRVVDGSVRRKSAARKRQRESRREREAEAARARREELKRLKNVKKKEMMEKLARIREVAGVRDSGGGGGVEALAEGDLDEEFDPEEYDRKMRDAFGEEYYGGEDPDFEGEDAGEIERPEFDGEEDEMLGLSSGNADGFSGFAAVRADLARASTAEGGTVRLPFEEKLLIDKHLDSYYKLDYEDVVGGVQTRFKYTAVNPNRYGLTTDSIIGLDDKDLNQYVSLKKLAPYKAEEWIPRRRAPSLSAAKWRKEPKAGVRQTGKRKAGESSANGNGPATDRLSIRSKPSDEERTEDRVVVEAVGVEDGMTAKKKRKLKRRRKTAKEDGKEEAFRDLPLSRSRLLSYASLKSKKMKGDAVAGKKNFKKQRR